MNKKILAILTILLTVINSKAQTTATDFKVNDCGGTSRHLFAELDAGKVIVLAMVHPCSSCIGPAKSALAISKTFETNNPGKVVYYLTDDSGNTPCATLVSWANSNTISGVPIISDETVTQANYGGSGMPKIVVIAGTNHKIYFNQNNGLNNANFTAAINNAIATSGLNETIQNDFKMGIYPNPVNNLLTVNYHLNNASEISFDIYNLLGTKVKSFASFKQNTGFHLESQFDTESLNNGIYFLKINADQNSQIIRFSVSH
ncbi:MAG: T9SS type A sorting domain-containing protein [Bacteroidia bacterium]